MDLKNIETSRAENDIETLYKQLIDLALNAKESHEALRELVENEYISEDLFHRFIEGEKKNMVSELQSYIAIFKGFN